ncbi:MAG: filamentous hemagglutinin N-terminal domain-containing protein [Magnetococcales bacterium]|nr:filamentous hemagglutinin N-terminal domain-containing protein [Magnetococcales bacterium]
MVACPAPSHAAGAVKFDGTLGGSTTAGDAVKTGSTFAIPQSQGVTQGRNLFHSFKQFDLTQGETAAFSGSNVNNVVSRVTGGAPSSIDGTIKSEIPNANLWFVNPKGMLFGPNARLDVTGSFHASSGDQIQFKDGGRFHADPSQQTTPLVSVDPVAFGFLGNRQMGNITVNGAQLTVPEKKSLSLVGGAVTANNAVLTAKSGQIAIVATDSAGTVQVEEGAAATGFDKMADITLKRTQSRPLGTSFDVEVSGATGKESGSVLVQGKAISVTGAGIGAVNKGVQAGGTVAIKASSDITLDGGGFASNGTINSNSESSGAGGAVTIATPAAVTMKNVSKVRVNSTGSGKGGTITVDAGSLVVDELSTDWSGLSAAVIGSGNGGTIQVNTIGDTLLSGPGAFFGANVFAGSSGVGGSIQVTSGGTLTLQSGGSIVAGVVGSGRGADIVLDVGHLVISDPKSSPTADTHLSAGTSGLGNSGTLSIVAKGDITLSGSRSFIDAASYSTGAGGDIRITNTGALTLRDGGSVEAIAWDAGKGGNIAVDAGSVALHNKGRIISRNYDSGLGGDLIVKSKGDILISGVPFSATGLYTETRGAGNAGSMAVHAGSDLVLKDDGEISSKVIAGAGGRGGALNIAVSGTTRIGNNSGLTSGSINTRTEGSGAGGAILVDTRDLEINQGGEIASWTRTGGAAGGAITVTANRINLHGGGWGAQILTTGYDGGNNGDISVTGRESIVLDGENSSFGATIISTGWGRSNSGSLRVTTPQLSLTRYGTISAVVVDGNAGDVSLVVDRFTMSGGILRSSVSGSGTGGTVRVTASESVSVAGRSDGTNILNKVSQIDSLTIGSGQAGQIIITAQDVDVGDGGRIAASTEIATTNGGRAGQIQIEADRVRVHDGGFVSAKSETSGRAGNITINAHERLQIDGSGSIHIPNGYATSGLYVGTTQSGQGGDVTIKTPILSMSSGGRVDSSTLISGAGGNIFIDGQSISLSGGSRIESSTAGAGAGGVVTVKAPQGITLVGKDSGLFGRSAAAGEAGKITAVTSLLTMTDQAEISTSGSGSGKAGDITLNDPSLRQVLLQGGAAIASSNSGAGDAGEIKLAATDQIDLANGSIRTEAKEGQGGSIRLATPKLTGMVGSVISASVTGGGKPGGTILFNGRTVDLSGGSYIESSTGGEGAGGVITVRAPDGVILSGKGSGLFGRSTAAGEAGKITAVTSLLTMIDQAEISTSGSGSGKAGDITLNDPSFQQVSLQGGAAIASSNSGAGDAGEIKLAATDKIELNNGSIKTEAKAGQGGSISFATPKLIGSAGSVISAGVLGGNKPGGTVLLDGQWLNLSGGSRIESSTAGAGAGGSIQINTQRIEMAGQSTIASNSTSTTGQAGQAGSITLTATDNLHLHDSEISSKSEQGGGGDIWVLVRDKIDLTDSAITTSVKGGDGGGGNIFIDPVYLILRRSRIEANAYEGAGGNIEINSQTLLRDIHSSVTASSALGLQGTVNINTPNTNVTDSLTSVPTQFVDISSLGQRSCARRKRGSGGSSFMVKGKGGLPEQPGDYRSSWQQPRPLRNHDEIGSITLPQAGGPYLAFNCSR